MDSREGGRKRWLGFIVTGHPIGRSELIHIFNRATAEGEPTPWLTYFQRGKGVIHCTDRNRDIILTIIDRAGRDHPQINVKTVVTSGSIKKVKKALEDEHA